MNKSRLVFWFRSIVAVTTIFSFILLSAVGVEAASTIGTNMSTTGTYTVTPASDSATSVRFQNAAGTNIFIVNSTARWVGIGAAPQTTFEVQGTSSASYFLTSNTIQVGGFASVAYNRFGTSATTHATEVTTTNDVVINGDLEVDSQAFFDSTASVGGAFEVVGRASASSGFITTNFVVGSNVASSSSVYLAEFSAPSTSASASFIFAGGGTTATTVGTCFQLKSTTGAWIYMRFNQGATTPTLSTVKCHN